MAHLVEVAFSRLHNPILVSTYESFDKHVLVGHAGGSGDNTGALIWAGCKALCEYVLAVKEERTSPIKVIELGSGSGLLASVAAIRFGAENVTVTDGSVTALQLCNETLLANDIRLSEGSIMPLNWDEPNCTSGFGNVHVVLAAEVVYPSSRYSSVRNLFKCADSLLVDGCDSAPPRIGERPAGSPSLCPPVFVMSYVQRRPETTLKLLHAAWTSGWRWAVVPWRDYWPCDSPPPLGAVVMEFRRCATSHTQSSMVYSAAVKDGSGDDGNDAEEEAVVDAILTAMGTASATQRGNDTFASILAASFPSVVPEINAARQLKAEIEEEYAQWGAPVPDEED